MRVLVTRCSRPCGAKWAVNVDPRREGLMKAVGSSHSNRAFKALQRDLTQLISSGLRATSRIFQLSLDNFVLRVKLPRFFVGGTVGRDGFRIDFLTSNSANEIANEFVNNFSRYCAFYRALSPPDAITRIRFTEI